MFFLNNALMLWHPWIHFYCMCFTQNNLFGTHAYTVRRGNDDIIIISIIIENMYSITYYL